MTQKALLLPVLRSHRAFLLQCSGKQSGQFFQPTDGLVQQLLRRVKIRETLGQIDGVILVIDAGHAADNGIRNVPTRSLSCGISSSFWDPLRHSCAVSALPKGELFFCRPKRISFLTLFFQ